MAKRAPKSALKRLEAEILKECMATLETLGFERWDSKHADARINTILSEKARGIFWRVSLGPIMRGGGHNGRAVPAPNEMAGFPDIAALSKRSGRLLTFEAKSSNGVMSIKQKVWKERLQAAGARWALVRSAEDLRAALTDWGELAVALPPFSTEKTG